MDTTHIKDPRAIETKSFEIITEELGHLSLPESSQAIVKRVVHTTADFEYARIVHLTANAVKQAKAAIRSGCRIYADTQMIIAGVNKRLLAKYNCSVFSYIAAPDVAEEAKKRGVTRSIVGIEKAASEPDVKLFVIGNAPTALFRIGELVSQKQTNPAMVIGVPVGFVGAAESKEYILQCPVESVVTKGRKGGSPVAVAILNAILLTLQKEDENRNE